MMTSTPMQDVRGWSRAAAFAVEHPIHCDNPVYVRALVPWHPVMADWAQNSWLFKALCWWTPKFLGAKVMACATCNTIEHESWWGRNFAAVCDDLFNLHGVERPLFVFDSDTELLPDGVNLETL